MNNIERYNFITGIFGGKPRLSLFGDYVRYHDHVWQMNELEDKFYKQLGDCKKQRAKDYETIWTVRQQRNDALVEVTKLKEQLMEAQRENKELYADYKSMLNLADLGNKATLELKDLKRKLVEFVEEVE